MWTGESRAASVCGREVPVTAFNGVSNPDQQAGLTAGGQYPTVTNRF